MKTPPTGGSPSWTDGAIVPTFLDETFGGENSGGGSSTSQGFSRSFRDNTAGVDVTMPYAISMFVTIDSFDGPSGGHFEIIDGQYGNENTANLRIFTVGPNNFRWEAKSGNSDWQDLGITLDLSQAYKVELNINPESFTYSARVSSVDAFGNVIDSSGLSGLSFNPNVINNDNNGNLLFYIQASAGGTDARVDNINIQSIPETSTALAAALALSGWAARRRRNAQAPSDQP